MKNINICLIIVVALIFLSACQNSSLEEGDSLKPVIKIAYLPITHSIPLLVQQELEKSLDLPYKIELVKFTTWPELVDALRQNKVDGASMLFEVAIKASEASKGLKLLSLSHRDGNIVVSDKSKESFKDLKGEIVAIPHKLSPHNMLLYMLLEKEGMSIEDIRVIELAPADMPSSLVSGSISAFIVAEPYGSISVSSETGKVLYTSKEIAEHSACCGIVFHNNFLSEHKELTKAFFEGFMKAAEESDKKDAFVVSTYGNYMNIKENVIEASLKTISFKDLFLSKEEYEHITDLAIGYDILSFVPEYEDFVYNILE